MFSTSFRGADASLFERLRLALRSSDFDFLVGTLHYGPPDSKDGDSDTGLSMFAVNSVNLPLRLSNPKITSAEQFISSSDAVLIQVSPN